MLEHNAFVNSVESQITRVLDPREWAEIVRPYAKPGEDRRPTLDWPRSVPFDGDDTPLRAKLENQADWMAKNALPKLHFAGLPGEVVLVGGRRRDTIDTFANMTTVEVLGKHWTPLDDPHAMGKGLAEWLPTLHR
ncbi:hypothetical protein [Streptomyces liangshanensis]|uniref:hypothetical protein n=1 Tax=Streptomyces liangshanensis TaxID=2717324 RepID=UPI0036DF4568